jgi:hypothetical protein
VLVVASGCTVTASTLAVFVDVVTGISGLAVVDDALTDRGCLVPLRCGLRMNRDLFLLPRGLHRLLRGKPTAPRGRTLGLLHGRSLEETSNLIVGLTGLRCRWLRHVAERHGGGDNVLAGLVEDWGFTHPVLDDAMIDIMSSLSSSSAMCTRHVLPLKGLLK